MSKSKEAKLSRQLKARITERDYNKLKEIAEQYHFKSLYSLLYYLVYAFLRAYDAERGCIAEEMPVEIVNLFTLKEDSLKALRKLASLRLRKYGWKGRFVDERDAAPGEELDLFELTRELGYHCVEDHDMIPQGEQFSHSIRTRNER